MLQQSLPLQRATPTLNLATSPLALLQLARDPMPFAHQLHRKMGDLFYVNIGNTKVLMINHPDHARYVLRDQMTRYTRDGMIWEGLRGQLGENIGNTGRHDYWLRQRRMMQPYFHMEALANITNLMSAAIEESVDRWPATGEPFNIHGALLQMTPLVLVQSLFGDRIPEAYTGPMMAQDVTDIFAFMLSMGMAFAEALPQWAWLPSWRRGHQARERMNAALNQLIEQRRQQQGPAEDILSLLVQSVDDETNTGMTNDQLRNEVLTLFLGGTETSAVGLTWAIDYIAHFPRVAARLRSEIDEVLGERHPTFQDVRQMGYMRMVIQEVLRLRPPVWWITRLASEDDVIDGVPVPKGTQVLANFYNIHHHPDFWEDPYTFNPDRFSPEQEQPRHKFAWLPFGAGGHTCMGREFAMLEMTLALTRILQRYRVEPVLSRLAKVVSGSGTKPDSAFKVRLFPR